MGKKALLIGIIAILLVSSTIFGVVNENEASTTIFTKVNFNEFLSAHPLDPEIGEMFNEIVSGDHASINFAQLVPGNDIASHYHASHDELVYIVEGEAKMAVNGREIIVKSGDMLYIPAHTMHSIQAIGNENLQIISIFAPPFDGKDRIFI